MELTKGRRERILKVVYRGLIICLIFIGLVIAGGTIYGVFLRARFSRAAVPVGEQSAISQKSGEAQTFTGIGRLRVSTADPEPGMVILFVSFVYYPDDRPFSEELALRIRDFREITTDYIGSFSLADLQKQDEGSIKSELLSRFNAILRLGQIEILYFSDFMIVG